jgi:hypothetical protein
MRNETIKECRVVLVALYILHANKRREVGAAAVSRFIERHDLMTFEVKGKAQATASRLQALEDAQFVTCNKNEDWSITESGIKWAEDAAPDWSEDVYGGDMFSRASVVWKFAPNEGLSQWMIKIARNEDLSGIGLSEENVYL